MDKMQSFEQFLTSTSMKIPVFDFVLNLLLAVLLSIILGKIYARYGTSLSNRRQFGGNFLLLTMTIMIIISIVKSSLALSLGLVGALSIVRFRAAIKEPEELTYLFLAIAIGLGLGADQRVITVVAFLIVVGTIIIKSFFIKRDTKGQNYNLVISSPRDDKTDLQQIVNILKEKCLRVNLKRFDETDEFLESSFQIDIDNYNTLHEIKNEVRKLNNSSRISFLDSRNII